MKTCTASSLATAFADFNSTFCINCLFFAQFYYNMTISTFCQRHLLENVIVFKGKLIMFANEKHYKSLI